MKLNESGGQKSEFQAAGEMCEAIFWLALGLTVAEEKKENRKLKKTKNFDSSGVRNENSWQLSKRA